MSELTDLLINIIKEEQLKTRKELWTTLFCWIDFSRTKAKHKVYNKEYQFLPLPKTFSDWQKQTTEFMIAKHNEIEQLINGYAPYFNANIKPILSKPEGDKTLLFRCKRLLENKVIGESSSLFLDLVIWEVEYRQMTKFKELLTNLNTQPMFLTDREDELFAEDCEKMVEGRINYLLAQRFFLKWSSLIAKSGVQKEEWAELGNYLKKWQAGKGASSEWHQNLKNMEQARDNLLNTPAEQPYFFSLGVIKEQTQEGITIATQNCKGVDLNNPYLMLFWFHQKPTGVKPLNYRGYFVGEFKMTDQKRLYVELSLSEDWAWRNYGRSLVSMGALDSGEHPVYKRE
jgi:hypothetical protein